MASHIGRRKFLATLGGAAGWPLAARAQQAPIPVIGFISSRSPGESEPDVAGFRQGLAQAGYVEHGWPGRGLEIFWTPARRIRINKDAISTGA